MTVLCGKYETSGKRNTVFVFFDSWKVFHVGCLLQQGVGLARFLFHEFYRYSTWVEQDCSYELFRSNTYLSNSAYALASEKNHRNIRWKIVIKIRKLCTDPLCEDCGVALFQHLFQLVVCGGAAGDLQLPLYPALAAVPVVRLRAVVLRHHLHELARQRRVLRLSYPQIRWRFIRVLFLLDILLYVCESVEPVDKCRSPASITKKTRQRKALTLSCSSLTF